MLDIEPVLMLPVFFNNEILEERERHPGLHALTGKMEQKKIPARYLAVQMRA